MSRGNSTSLSTPDSILYGRLQPGPVRRHSADNDVLLRWQQLTEDQQWAITALLDLEQSSVLDSVGYADERQRWDISMICYHLLNGCHYEDKQARKEYQAKVTRLLVSAKPSGLITNKRYPGIKHVRWKLTDTGKEIFDMYHSGMLKQKPPVS